MSSGCVGAKEKGLESLERMKSVQAGTFSSSKSEETLFLRQNNFYPSEDGVSTGWKPLLKGRLCLNLHGSQWGIYRSWSNFQGWGVKAKFPDGLQLPELLLASGTLARELLLAPNSYLMHHYFLSELKGIFFSCWIKPHCASKVLTLTFSIFSLIKSIF